MKITSELRKFITDDQILECLIMFETRKVKACKKLSAYMFDKWRITTLQAMDILKIVSAEWNTQNK